MPAKDIDGDGLYGDVNGDGSADFNDVVDLAINSPEESYYSQFFDFDGDVDFDDAIELAFQICPVPSI